MKIANYVRRKMAEWVVGNLRIVDPRLYDFLGSHDIDGSGAQVTVHSAMQLAAVWSCVRLIAETIATLPIALYRRKPGGQKVPANDHLLYFLLHDQPNFDMTAAEYWECVVACILLWGNSYSLKKFTGGKLSALEPLRPEWMKPFRNKRGGITYRYRDPEAKGDYVDYSEDQIFHVKGFGTTGLMGLSPISYARLSLGNAIAVEQAVSSTFRNGMRPSGVLTTDQVLKQSAVDALGDKMAEKFAGTINAGKVPVLQGGFKFQAVNMNPEDAQMLETRAFAVEEICRWFRVPPFMIGHTEKVTSWGTGIEQQMIAFLTFALKPYLVRIEQAIRRSLIAPEEQRTIYAEFILEGLLRADSAGRAAFYGQMIEKGVYTRNEIRAKENLPPVEGGDRLTVQVNMTFLDLLGTVPAPANTSIPAQEAATP
jgi:HK97 family phage portal protein